jgi:glycosyltransferase involved in cell wall biosynthesis
LRILVVSQYYPPEVGATQNRMGSFVDGLVARGHRVTVLCEQPNHPAGVFAAGFGRRPVISERVADGLTIHRLWVAASPVKTTARRLAFYGTFAAAAGLWVSARARHDVVFATSPPLPGPLIVGAAAAWRGMPFVLDVRDLWPAAAEALGELSNARIISALEQAERWLYRHSAAVTATTRPFCRHIDALAGRRVSVHVPNGALDELLEIRAPATRPPGAPFTVAYAGNMGIAQGLGIVLGAADLLRETNVRFLVIGDGPLSADLRSQREERALHNVEIRPSVPVTEIGDILAGCDAILVPLRAHHLLEQFVPSKLYDAMALGRPVILAARGEAEALLSESGAGIAVAPEDAAELADAVVRLAGDPALAHRLGAAGRRAAKVHVRSHQIERLDAVLAQAAATGRRRMAAASGV